MGKPPSVVKAPGGAVVWQYPTGPLGQRTYMVDFGPDQRVTSVYQALTEARFAKIRARNDHPGRHPPAVRTARPDHVFQPDERGGLVISVPDRGEQQLDLQR